VLMISLT